MTSTKTLAALVSESAGRQAPYPNVALKIKVVKVGHSVNFTGTTGEPCTILNFSVADSTDAVLASLNDQSKSQQIKEGRSLMVRNFIFKAGKVVLTKNTRILSSAPVSIPEHLAEKGQHLISPPSPQKSLKDVRGLPKSQLVSVVGQIVKDEAIRTVQVGGDVTDIHTVRLCDDGEEVDVSLWRELSTVPLKIGQFVKITHALTGNWMGKVQLNSTRNTTITEMEVPESELSGEVEGITIQDNTVEIAVNTDGNYKDLNVAIDQLRQALGLSEEAMPLPELEEHLASLLPLAVNLTIQGSAVLTISMDGGDDGRSN